jgi:hypothetical protein
MPLLHRLLLPLPDASWPSASDNYINGRTGAIHCTQRRAAHTAKAKVCDKNLNATGCMMTWRSA